MRPYGGEADLDAIAPFLKTCAAVDPPTTIDKGFWRSPNAYFSAIQL